ncbi:MULTISPECIES: glutaminase [unclassified Microbacterium]|uniref:glutaminase n=1 Tax=unclassified Microbacterium TaxID=2609290 RepID=UPI0038676E1E
MTDATTTEILDVARARLQGSPRERLGVWASSRRILGLGRAPRILPLTEAWHVGVLLIGDDRVFATGEVLRARHDAVRGFTAESQRARSDRAAAAHRGGFAEGEVVHLDWTELDPGAVDRGETSGILSRVGGIVQVRWSSTGASRPLAAYLDDMLSLR